MERRRRGAEQAGPGGFAAPRRRGRALSRRLAALVVLASVRAAAAHDAAERRGPSTAKPKRAPLASGLRGLVDGGDFGVVAVNPLLAEEEEHGPPMIVMPGTLPNSETGLSHSIQSLAFQPWTYGNQPEPCTNRFRPPAVPPTHGTDYNGVALPDTCFYGDDEHHVFVIGDWGGVLYAPGTAPVPADHRSAKFKGSREFVVGVDDRAQLNVAAAMASRAASSYPDYVLNSGDNFYWGGITVKCGAPPASCNDPSGQWEWVYERIYAGEGMDMPQWLGVLGNHDFGGFMFTSGWDQVIAYTWADLPASTGRWIVPALYYSAKVHYIDFSVEYFFVDTNSMDAHEPGADEVHNICSQEHNYAEGATCGVQGPMSVQECPQWFKKLWHAQLVWLERGLEASTADWQVIVTHFPPEHGVDEWMRLTQRYGVDLLITGHRHQQEVHFLEDDNFLRPTPYIVSGGGGGITSEALPDVNGTDDMYGFMDLTLTRQEIRIEAISHSGQVRSTTCFRQRRKGGAVAPPFAGPSLCAGRPARAPAPPPPPPPAEPAAPLAATAGEAEVEDVIRREAALVKAESVVTGAGKGAWAASGDAGVADGWRFSPKGELDAPPMLA